MFDDKINTSLDSAIARRRTFAIISHPDAGKTTLTEKLLLYGGAIHTAGAVKNRRAERAATSDWMALEQQRGISITSTVLQFEYDGKVMNLLDTPGHHDFSEDTYRTLAAADNAVMLVDAAKGLETQTRKLFEVARLRRVPIFTFINKMDRPARHPMELLDEIEQELGLSVYAMNWPIGEGESFRGIYDRMAGEVLLYDRNPHGKKRAEVQTVSLDDPALEKLIGAAALKHLKDDLELVEGAGHDLDPALILSGEKSPVFFASAMTNFGVEPFLRSFIRFSAPPAARMSDLGRVPPNYQEFTGFVFKLQANMDPRHRDCLAFVRVCSGEFEKDMTVTNARTGRKIRLARPQKVFAREREGLEEGYAGDVIGLNNPGAFTVGDTLFTGPALEFEPIPTFSPEHFARLRNVNSAAAKKFNKGIDQLMEEKAIQVLSPPEGGSSQEPVLAAVGELQFEVVQYRLKAEYGVETSLERLPYSAARWVGAGWDALAAGEPLFQTPTYKDDAGRPVLLFRNPWHLEATVKERPDLQLTAVAISEARAGNGASA